MHSDLHTLIVLLGLSERIQDAANEVLRPRGLTWASFKLLLQLRDGQHSQKDLAECVGCGAPNITRAVGRLEKNGLVVRHACPEDRRTVLTELSEEGQRVLADACAALHPVQASLLEQLPGLEQVARDMQGQVCPSNASRGE